MAVVYHPILDWNIFGKNFMIDDVPLYQNIFGKNSMVDDVSVTVKYFWEKFCGSNVLPCFRLKYFWGKILW